MQRLGMAKNGSHSFHAGATDIVEWILLRETPSGSPAVGAESKRFRILRIELLDNLCPSIRAARIFAISMK